MRYWGENEDSHIRFCESSTYKKLLHGKVSAEGYMCDNLQKSDVLFLGSCDLMTAMPYDSQRWADLIHSNFYNNDPKIFLGTIGAGLQTMVRRLYSYIKNYGAPKILYMTVPRFDSYEFVNKSGKCYSLSTRKGSAEFSKLKNLIDDTEYNIWIDQLNANKKLSNQYNNRYILEERFSFIETLCFAHNIELKWTFNLSDASIVLLYNNIEIFKDISDFMKESFVGLSSVSDHLYDRSIGPETHRNIYESFKNPISYDFDLFKINVEKNYKWLQNKYGNDLIKYEA